ncbi:MAG: efflux RND transporter periplasmic adaptor subunit [bacterium]|jgi:HlyD family secretion protein
MAHRLKFVIPVLVIAAAAYFVWNYQANKAQTGNGSIKISGNIEATERDLSFKIAGRVIERAASEGDRIEPGALVARLDDAELLADAAIRRAELEAARAALEELKAGARPQEIAQAAAIVKQADAKVRELESGARPQERETAEASVRQAQAEVDRLKADFERAEKLFNEGVISGQAFDAAKTALTVATERLKTAQEQRDLVESGPKTEQIDQARAALSQAKESYSLIKAGPRAERIAQAEARVKQAEEALSLSETRLGYAALASPAGGVVVSENVEPGEYVVPGTPVVTLAELDKVYLRGFVSETELGIVKIGQVVKVSVDAFPGKTFDGKIVFISPESEFTPKTVQTKEERTKLVYRIKIEIANAGGELKPGMPADAAIEINGE